MKSFDTDAALKRLGHAPTALPVVCFQNGVSNEPLVKERFTNTYGGLVYFAARFLEPGVVFHVSENSLGIGRYPEGIDETGERVCDVLTRAGFRATSYPKIMAVKWYKLFLNLSNALLAILGVSYGEGFRNPRIRSLIIDVLQEALDIVRAAGIEIIPFKGRTPPEAMIARLRDPPREPTRREDEKTKIYPSTWQDLTLRRGRTEADDLNGEIVRLGKSMNMKTPVNAFLMETVNQMAHEKRPPGFYSIDRLYSRIYPTGR